MHGARKSAIFSVMRPSLAGEGWPLSFHLKKHPLCYHVRMHKYLIATIIGILLLAAGYYVSTQKGPAKSYKDATYIIEAQPVTLKDGFAETPQADSASKITTRYFGNEVRKDINGDGIEDIVFLITQSTGGSGTYFYVVAALGDEKGGYTGSNAFLLGDRIAPQTTAMGLEPNSIIVNYADRAEGEPMTERPSMGKSAFLLFDTASNSFTPKSE